MIKMKTNAKKNPITGEPIPIPSYAQGKQSNFAGSDRKREGLTSSAGRGTATTALQSGGTKRGKVKTSQTNSTQEASKSQKPKKDWREKSRVGALLGGTPYVGGKDKGGKKGGVVKGGKGGRPNYKTMDESCQKPK